MTPRATYRFQFHKDFPFARAEALLPYLDRLGISHVYASPITTAAAGSTHGYDVIDPTRINPELGGEEAFRSLAQSARDRGMGLIIDIVPNHMGVGGGGNRWWNDVLTHGADSAYARFFDIDWSRKLVLPILGSPLSQTLADGQIAVERADGQAEIVAYGEHRLPIRDEDQADAETLPLADLLDRQHYRLASWRVSNDELNWRRFFTINDLAGLRVEDDAVFEETHALYFRLYAEGLIDGVRIDHVDGLTDPIGYCRKLRQRFDTIPRDDGNRAYIVVEKILAADEAMGTDWGVDGTSGYDFMEEVSALLHAPEGTRPLADLWAQLSGRSADFGPEELQAREDLLAWQFAGQLDQCVTAFAKLPASATDLVGSITTPMLRRAIERLLWVFPVYRTYGPDAPETDRLIRDEARSRVERFIPPGEAFVVDQILTWLAGDGPGEDSLRAEAVRRFQQLSAPIAAKAVEDTAFYRHGVLLSRNDVGFDAGRMSMPIAEFHDRMTGRAERFPRAMLTTATHDHKRGEDVRARLAVLSAMPDEWREIVERWRTETLTLSEGVDPADWYMLVQTLVGAWPGAPALEEFVGRVAAWQEKALREGKLRSSWEEPDSNYEKRCNTLAKALITGTEGQAFRADLAALLKAIAPAATANSLAQLGLRYTVPGIPDCYQGTELEDLSLVDPDNRRPVDYAAREAALSDGSSAKMTLLATLLAARRQHPALFAEGDYQPLAVTGHGKDRVLAFRRTHEGTTLTVVVGIRLWPLMSEGQHVDWRDTQVVIDDERHPVAELLADTSFWHRIDASA
ncbi:malto-oligosyltrehalose synthase [Sphingomonas sp. S17]|uniref:Malto-oligosyltrehalose synthase n=2 Tax=Sphingomonas paucimobilis TaxID=13689 RepID=A0A411LFK9_SPHPI|nr:MULTISPECIES: malto-oligosyltrehalose synthase [Sphingomonas]EGI56724.1 malto-oligosyltrehalose synthase [Sphingomonas sp. S17]MBQ1479930.1 malto-oligosyltrehalose synthase [Sphingomonas sp.]MCM3679169.1 malto-oligosyltrehalose synthase [Sphingomonas paucimobilis]MDG5971922.1 malto-oligosyltrehalose synthase [Sphingomonas paucimobilis]NNG58069.1 malto-oligosyltrehalose synthase [Sphingomonas paucimobilis]